MAEDSKKQDNKFAGLAVIGADTKISIDGKTISSLLIKVRLTQYVHDHHVLEAVVAGKSVGQAGVDGLAAKDAANMLGAQLTLTVNEMFGAGTRGEFAEGETMSWTGPVTDVRFEATPEGMSQVVLVASSPSVVMDAGPRNEILTATDTAQVVDHVIGRHSISVGKKDVEAVTCQYITQYRESDYDFLLRVASAANCFAYYDGAKFQVQKASNCPSATVTYGASLSSFSLSVGARPVKFTTISRDYMKDETTSSTKYSKPSLNGGLEPKSPKISESMFSTPGFIEASSETDMAGLDRMLQHATGVAYAQAVRCTGQSAITRIQIGNKVEVGGMDDANGTFWLEKVEHIIEDGVYYNRFEGVAIGAAFPRPRRERPKVTDLQTAHVTDLNDPDNLGRVKVKFDWLEADADFWLRCASPHAGDGHGWYSRPEINDEVLVAFEGGNPDRPIVLGALYNGKAKPALDDTADNNLKWFLTKSGNKIEFSDEDGKEKITIVSKGEECTIVMDAAEKSISITANGDLSLTGDNVKIEAKQKLEIKSGTDAQLKAGANLKVESSANADVKAGAMMNLKGAMINLN